MGRWHNFYVDNHVHFCTYTAKDWRPLLTEPAIECLYDEWHKNSKRFAVQTWAYVIMPEHVHMLLWSEQGNNILRFIQRTLGQTSKRLSPAKESFWKERPRVFPIYSEDIVREKIEYIHANPVRRGLTETPEAWPQSSYSQLVLGDNSPAYQCARIAL